MEQPIAGVKVPATALKLPPVPVVRVQTPPGCCPVISVARLMGVVLESQVVALPSTPALACPFTTTVAVAVTGKHPAEAAGMVYVTT